MIDVKLVRIVTGEESLQNLFLKDETQISEKMV